MGWERAPNLPTLLLRGPRRQELLRGRWPRGPEETALRTKIDVLDQCDRRDGGAGGAVSVCAPTPLATQQNHLDVGVSHVGLSSCHSRSLDAAEKAIYGN